MTSNRSLIATAEPSVSASESRSETSTHRAVLTIGLLSIALIHLLDLHGKLAETPYMGVLFIGVIVASLGLAGMLAVRDARMARLAAGALAAAVILGYAVTRTVGMPGAMDDIGNWLEPLGVASLFVEGTVVWFAFPALRRD